MKNFSLVVFVMVLSLIFVSCKKDDNSGESAKNVKVYNGFLYRNYNRSSSASADWVYAQEKITIKEFDTYMEVQVGNNSIQSTKMGKDDKGKINKVTFSREWSYSNPISGALGLDHSSDEVCFDIEQYNYGTQGATLMSSQQIVVSPDIEFCRTHHHKSAYNQIIVVSTKTNQSILSIL